MVRSVNIEPISKKQEFLATPALTKEELTNAFEECLKQVDLNMEYFKDRFPYSCTKGLKYPIIDNIEWTDGFWTGMPTVIVAKTIKGKGVSFMEDQQGWHGVAPNEEQYHAAMKELEAE